MRTWGHRKGNANIQLQQRKIIDYCRWCKAGERVAIDNNYGSHVLITTLLQLQNGEIILDEIHSHV